MEPQIDHKEAGLILDYLARTSAILGDITEFGCYMGDMSLLLAKNTSKKLWLYDSFEGLPTKSQRDISALGDNFQAGELKTSKLALLRRFQKANLPTPIVKKAWFADLTLADLPAKVSFALLDGDYYESIKDSLRLTAPTMQPGGIIVAHDYQNPALPGVATAINEWLAQNPHRLKIERSLAIIFF